MLAGVGMMMVCCSSSVAALMMGVEEETPAATTPAGPSAVPNVLSDPVGTPIQCNANDVGSGANAAVYRYMGGTELRLYPNPPIAASWDPDWNTTFKTIDCDGLTEGEEMPYNVEVGDPVQCNANDVGSGVNSAVYRVEAGKKLRHYPNPPIATSWDPDWGSTYKKIDCDGLTEGEKMSYNTIVGDPVQCTANDVGSGVNAAVYRVEADNVLRHYPNPPIASSWDPDWGTTFKKIDCQGYTQGPAMAAKP